MELQAIKFNSALMCRRTGQTSTTEARAIGTFPTKHLRPHGQPAGV